VTEVPCAWCRRPVEPRDGPGRPRRYCRRSCRQRAFEARRRATELGLGDDELIVTRARLDQLGDRVYVLRCALEDVERDLATVEGEPTPDDLRAALAWLREAAEGVVGWDAS
jgi:hypothetical protein